MDTIHSQDIARADPLAVYVKEGCDILDAAILYEEKPANQFAIRATDSKSQVLLGLEYADKDEGAVLQIIHTGRAVCQEQRGKNVRLRLYLDRKRPWGDSNARPTA